MTVFQSELDNATINALPKLKQSIALLLEKTKSTIAIVEAATHLTVTDTLTNVTGSDEFLMGSLYCNHPLSYIQLLGVSPSTLKNQYQDPSGLVSELLLGIKKRLKAAIYIVVYSAFCSPALKKNHNGQVILGFQFSDRSLIKKVPVMGTTEEIKRKISFATLTYLKNYLELYQQEEISVQSQYA
jgi:nicotinamide mononucleotide (NMN) deamidase PncC